MNEDQVVNIVQSPFKIGGGIVAGYGAEASNLWAAIGGLIVSAIAFYFSHRSNASTPASTPSK